MLDDSGIPGAILRYRVTNRLSTGLAVSVLGSLPNVVGFKGFDAFRNLLVHPGGKNTFREEESLRGLFYSTSGLPADSMEYGSMALATSNPSVSRKVTWLDGGWFDGIQDLWDDFSTDGSLTAATVVQAPGSKIRYQEDRPLVGSLCASETIPAGEEKVFEFLLTWHFPNRVRGWRAASTAGEVMKNYYATKFSDAWAAASYLAANGERLETGFRKFHGALFGSTMPPEVIDALANNITVIRSPTCFRLSDGTFVSWEGCHDTEGCCDGSCTHVWNYAQTLAFLFPELERTMRRVEFAVETDDDGRMAFRARRIFGLPKWEMLPAADGQLGAVVRLYRDWKLSGDDGFLRSLWEKAARALDFAFDFWDTDGDAVLDSEQHNTYDIEFYGPNSLMGSIFYAALKAGAEMAAFLGDDARSARYQRALTEGSARMDALLWSGEYYVQKIADVDEYRYQYGTAASPTSSLARPWRTLRGWATSSRDHVKAALKSIFRHNFCRDLRGNANAPAHRTCWTEKRGSCCAPGPTGEGPACPSSIAMKSGLASSTRWRRTSSTRAW